MSIQPRHNSNGDIVKLPLAQGTDIAIDDNKGVYV